MNITFAFNTCSEYGYFRLEFTGAPMIPADVMAETINPPDSAYAFSEIKLHAGGHGAMPADYKVFIEFMKMHF